MRTARLAAAILAAAALLSCSGDDDPSIRSTATGPPTSTVSTSVQTGPTTSTPGPRLTAPGDTSQDATPSTTALPAVDLGPGGPPPWSGSQIASGDARRVGIDEWLAAENKDQARLVLPAGVDPTGAFCETCGRGVAGVAGTGSLATRDFGPPFTNVVQWSDGSAVGYTGARPDNRQFLANLYVNGQGALYQVWSYVSQRHLEYLISQLRFVEGTP